MDLLWTDFVNSEWYDWRGSGDSEDRLDNREWLESYIDRWHLMAPMPPSSQVMEGLKTFRTALRRMATELAAGGALTDDDLSYLNHVMTGGPVIRSIVREGEVVKLELIATNDDWTSIQSEIAADFADTLVHRDGHRVRVCENADCLWVFYDDTRNRSKRYCDDKLCGNLMKVRRFRSRTKQSEGR